MSCGKKTVILKWSFSLWFSHSVFSLIILFSMYYFTACNWGLLCLFSHLYNGFKCHVCHVWIQGLDVRLWMFLSKAQSLAFIYIHTHRASLLGEYGLSHHWFELNFHLQSAERVFIQSGCHWSLQTWMILFATSCLFPIAVIWWEQAREGAPNSF